jgi:hypothetical protein
MALHPWRAASRLLLESAGAAPLPDWRARRRAFWSRRCLASLAAFPTGPLAGLMERRGSGLRCIHYRLQSGRSGSARRTGEGRGGPGSNLERKQFEAAGLDDSKVMMGEDRILHAFRRKGGATVPEDCMADAYQVLQEPDFAARRRKRARADFACGTIGG